jgi:hypothetical protein
MGLRSRTGRSSEWTLVTRPDRCAFPHRLGLRRELWWEMAVHADPREWELVKEAITARVSGCCEWDEEEGRRVLRDEVRPQNQTTRSSERMFQPARVIVAC